MEIDAAVNALMEFAFPRSLEDKLSIISFFIEIVFHQGSKTWTQHRIKPLIQEFPLDNFSQSKGGQVEPEKDNIIFLEFFFSCSIESPYKDIGYLSN